MTFSKSASTRCPLWVLLFTLLITIGTLPAEAGKEVTVDGVVHVKNSSTPSQGVETIELEELWRAGGEDDEDVIMGVIVHALSDEEGNIYLLDMQLGQVFVYSPDGEMIGTLSRQGQGPGEVQNPADMVFMDDGSLGILQTFPGKLVTVTTDDVPGPVITLGGDPTEGGFVIVVDVDNVSGNLVMAGTDIKQGDQPTQQERISFLAAVNQDGSLKTRYWEKSQKLDFLNLKMSEADQYNIFPRRWAISGNGEVCAATERDEYHISVFAPDGTLKRVIEKDFENRKRTAEEMEFFTSLVELQTRQLPGAEISIGDYPETISFIEAADDGAIWVVDSRGSFEQPEGIFSTYSVFDKKGHYQKDVMIACEGNGTDDGLIRVSDDRMVLIKGLLPAVQAMQTGGAGGTTEDEEAEAMEIICYKMKK